MSTKNTTAFALLSTKTNDAERAEAFVVAIQRNLQRTIIDKLVEQIEKLQDENYELREFNLTADMNAGIKALTKEECETRFSKLINNEFKLKMLQLELDVKRQSFDSFFAPSAPVAVEVTK